MGCPVAPERSEGMARAAVDRLFERRLAALVNRRERGALAGGRRGLEREGMRVTPAGRVSARRHPRALGSALCNPHITTDFSEALLELVSPTFTDNAALVKYLGDLHHFVARFLGDELLWAGSMPGEIAGEAEVPIADYGRSHRGQFKEVYRRGPQERAQPEAAADTRGPVHHFLPADLRPPGDAGLAS